MNKPKLAENEAGAKRTRDSKKMNDANIAKLSTMEQDGSENTQEINLLLKQSEEIDKQLLDSLDPVKEDYLNERIARITKTLEELDNDTPEEIEQEQEEAIVENKTKKIGKKLAKTRDRFKKLHGSVEALTVGSTYKMVGTAEELGDFHSDPMFKVVGRNVKEDDTCYAIEYEGGKGKILASNLPEVTEVQISAMSKKIALTTPLVRDER
jgi:glutamyl/glutaminyl-tRNA synthetase